MGKPDIEALDISSVCRTLIVFSTLLLNLIIDADTGGKPEHFAMNVRSMERLGISAVIIEDKPDLRKILCSVMK